MTMQISLISGLQIELGFLSRWARSYEWGFSDRSMSSSTIGHENVFTYQFGCEKVQEINILQNGSVHNSGRSPEVEVGEGPRHGSVAYTYNELLWVWIIIYYHDTLYELHCVVHTFQLLLSFSGRIHKHNILPNKMVKSRDANFKANLSKWMMLWGSIWISWFSGSLGLSFKWFVVSFKSLTKSTNAIVILN